LQQLAKNENNYLKCQKTHSTTDRVQHLYGMQPAFLMKFELQQVIIPLIYIGGSQSSRITTRSRYTTIKDIKNFLQLIPGIKQIQNSFEYKSSSKENANSTTLSSVS
jgi:hypothetical protein